MATWRLATAANDADRLHVVRRGPGEVEWAFLRGLRERGWLEGQNLAIDFRCAAFDRPREWVMVGELLALQPPLIVVADGSGARATIRSQSPGAAIVAPALGDLVAQGVTSGPARPLGNATGDSVFATELARKRLELLKEALPDLRCSALYDAAAPPSGVAVSVDAGRECSIEVHEMPVRLPDGIGAALAATARQGVPDVASISSTTTTTDQAPLGEQALTHRLPTIFASRSYPKARGLVSCGPGLEAALPIEQPSSFQFVPNQRTARALAVKCPQSLLLRADEVID